MGRLLKPTTPGESKGRWPGSGAGGGCGCEPGRSADLGHEFVIPSFLNLMSMSIFVRLSSQSHSASRVRWLAALMREDDRVREVAR